MYYVVHLIYYFISNYCKSNTISVEQFLEYSVNIDIKLNEKLKSEVQILKEKLDKSYKHIEVT